LFGIVFIAALARRVSMQIAGRPATRSSSCSQAVNEQASKPLANYLDSDPPARPPQREQINSPTKPRARCGWRIASEPQALAAALREIALPLERKCSSSNVHVDVEAPRIVGDFRKADTNTAQRLKAEQAAKEAAQKSEQASQEAQKAAERASEVARKSMNDAAQAAALRAVEAAEAASKAAAEAVQSIENVTTRVRP
jgi:hypothetical protein